MRSRSLLVLVASLAAGCQAGTSEAASPNSEQVQTVEFPRIGLRFTVPEGFLVGRFAEDVLPPGAADQGFESPWRDAVVLVEPTQLMEYDLEAIPVGEIPVVWVDRPATTTSVLGRIIEADSTFSVPAGTVFRYPGFPGPYGDQAFYFVVELAAEDYAEIAAHRFSFRTTDMEPSHYDEAIYAILQSLEVIEREEPPGAL